MAAGCGRHERAGHPDRRRLDPVRARGDAEPRQDVDDGQQQRHGDRGSRRRHRARRVDDGERRLSRLHQAGRLVHRRQGLRPGHDGEPGGALGPAGHRAGCGRRPVDRVHRRGEQGPGRARRPPRRRYMGRQGRHDDRRMQRLPVSAAHGYRDGRRRAARRVRRHCNQFGRVGDAQRLDVGHHTGRERGERRRPLPVRIGRPRPRRVLHGRGRGRRRDLDGRRVEHGQGRRCNRPRPLGGGQRRAVDVGDRRRVGHRLRRVGGQWRQTLIGHRHVRSRRHRQRGQYRLRPSRSPRPTTGSPCRGTRRPSRTR